MKLNRNLLLTAGLSMMFAACGGDKNAPGTDSANKTADTNVSKLLGAGSTFVNPLYTKMFDQYNQEKGIQVNYQSIGSGGGIKQLQNRTVDFGASDAFLDDTKMAAMPGPVVHIPTCMGAVVMMYNIPGVTDQLTFDGATIADIYLGKIKKWNDPAIMKLNPGVKLPDMDIMVARRGDGSGTTWIFTHYLNKVSPDWKSKVGCNTSVNWPVGLGGKGSEGVSGIVKQTPGGIGYVELIYAMQNNISFSKVLNASGAAIVPSLESVKAAGNTDLPDDLRFSITNTPSADGYPISGASWVLLYKEQSYDNRTQSEASALVNLVWWMIHDGQSDNEPLSYAKLPPAAVQKAEVLLKSVTYNGKPVMQ